MTIPKHSLALAAAVVVLAGCGGHKATTTTAPAPAPVPATTAATATTAAAPPGALKGEATSAAAGDIPDNQVFLVFRNRAAGYSMKYPEGWAQLGAGGSVTFRDKNNIVRVVVRPAGQPTAASVRSSVPGAHVQGAVQRLSLGRRPAFKVVYTTESSPNPVTGKRVTLTVDRYDFSNGTKEATVDLGTPVGVDNVDAYRLMIESFRWG